jgi:hypothetical protein
MNKPSQQTSRRRASFGWFREPTMEEMLSDPIVQAMMAADNVDPKGLERGLRSVAAMLKSAERTADRSARGSSTEL